MISKRVELAKKIVIDAGKILHDEFSSNMELDVAVKSDNSFVTEKDKEIEKFLIKKIKDVYPDDGFLGEEGANVEGGSGFSWIIDPIDGTTNFIYRLPLYSISVGITRSGFIEGGVVYLPSLSKLYFVEKGAGFCSERGRCEVSDTKSLDKSIVAFSIAHKPRLEEINKELYPFIFNEVRKLRILGSVSMEMALVAAGQIDAVVNVGSNAWDVTAGVLMVREAGGKVVDFEGNDWTSGASTLISGNEMVIDQLIDLLKRNNISF